MVVFNLDLRVDSIEFMIDACEYRIKRIREGLKKFEDAELTVNPEPDKGTLVSKTGEPQDKSLSLPIEYDPFGNIKPVKITIFPDPIKAIPIYEFNAFSTELMACVNYLIDLKLRLLDGYEGEKSKTVGQYIHETNERKTKLIKNKGNAHDIILQDYIWIKLIKEIRDRVNHTYIQSKLHGLIKPYKKNDALKAKTDILLPYVELSSETPTMINYCETNLENLKAFKSSMFKELMPG